MKKLLVAVLTVMTRASGADAAITFSSPAVQG
jgi:hypothetical protein